MAVRLFVENTRSRKGGHVARGLAFVVGPNGTVVPVDRYEGARLVGESAGLYSRGLRRLYEVELVEGLLGVQLLLVRNTRGWVKGRIWVLDPSGSPVYAAVIRELKARYSGGSPEYSWAAEAVMRFLGLHERLKKLNLGGETS